jgi:uncharacterized membrane protein
LTEKNAIEAYFQIKNNRTMYTSIFGKFIVSLILISLTVITSSNAQNCNSDLKIYQNRDMRSVNVNSPTNFQMILTNKNAKPVTYTLGINNKVVNCNSTTKAISSTSRDVPFNISFLQNSRSVNSITVPANGDATFYVNVASSSDLKQDSITCIQVEATAQNCQNGPMNSIVKVYTSSSSNN